MMFSQSRIAGGKGRLSDVTCTYTQRALYVLLYCNVIFHKLTIVMSNI